jgi:hypothetical protein
MTYSLNATAGGIQIPSNTIIRYKNLDLVGRDSTDWNKPIQQNFVTLVDKLDTEIATKVNSSDIGAISDFNSAFASAL